MARYRFSSRLRGLIFNTPPRLIDATDGATGKPIKVYIPPVRVQFVEGYYETDDEYVAKAIREHKLFGVEIFALEDIMQSIPEEVRKEMEAEAGGGHSAAVEPEPEPESEPEPPLEGASTADLVEALLARGVKAEELMDKRGRISPAKVRSYAAKYNLI